MRIATQQWQHGAARLLMLLSMNARLCAGQALQLRLLFERAGVAAVQQRAEAAAALASLQNQLASTQKELQRTSEDLTSAQEDLRLRGMELDGANAQLRV
jgi:hypothetical protein